MKKHIFNLTILLLTLIVGYSQTNVYHPFPESNAIWRVYNSSRCYPFFRYYTEDYQNTLGKDTIIEKNIYKKIYKSGFYYTCSGDQIPHYFNNYAGALRQDTINKLVYYRGNTDHDSILCDFNKKVGDTIYEHSTLNITPQIYKIVITSIDSILVGSTYRKQFHFGDNPFTIIEGIGKTSGLLEPLVEDGFDTYWNLVCFQHNSDIYPDTINACTPTKVNELSKKEIPLTIYPNPTDGLININTVSKKYKIEITDLIGRIIYKSANSEKQINLFNKPDGIYFIRLIQNNTILKKAKLIINKF